MEKRESAEEVADRIAALAAPLCKSTSHKMQFE